MVFKNLILLFAFLLMAVPSQDLNAQSKSAFSSFAYHVTEDGAFGLHKPKGWKVGIQEFPNGGMVGKVFIAPHQILA